MVSSIDNSNAYGLTGNLSNYQSSTSDFASALDIAIDKTGENSDKKTESASKSGGSGDVGSMSACSKCGSIVMGNAAVCPKCGSDMSGQESSDGVSETSKSDKTDSLSSLNSAVKTEDDNSILNIIPNAISL